jgi:hypothetical protein
MRRHGKRSCRVDDQPPAEVPAGQRIGAAQFGRRPVEDDAPAPFARSRPHVDHAVRSQHHLRVMLDDHQRIAGVTQPVHHLHYPVHVARMKPDRWLVQHEQRIDQRRTERRGQVDPLHLATRQRAALAVEGEVAEADIDQERQTGAQLVEQHLDRFVERGRQLDLVEETLHPVDRQQHQVVQRQAGQGGELGIAPVRSHRPVAPVAATAAERIVRFVPAARAPQQRIGLQPGAGALRARRVRAIARQEHAYVHLVRLALQPFEEALGAIPDPWPALVPALPSIAAFDHPALLRLGQFAERHIEWNSVLRCALFEVALAFDERFRLERLDRTLRQRLSLVRDDEAIVDADHTPETPAGVTGAERRIERKRARMRRLVVDVALGAVQIGAVAPRGPGLGPGRAGRVGRRVDVDVHASAAESQGALDGIDAAGAVRGVPTEAVGHNVQDPAVAAWPLSMYPRVALRLESRADLAFAEVLRHPDGKREDEAGIQIPCPVLQAGEDRRRRVAPDRTCADAAEQPCAPREQQLQVIVQLGHRADRAARCPHRIGLVDRDRGRHAFDSVHRRPVHAVQELARVRRERLHVAALALGVQRIEYERTLAGARHAGHYDQFTRRDVDIEVAKIVLPRAANADRALGL